MKFCQKCGHEMSENDTICRNCGCEIASKDNRTAEDAQGSKTTRIIVGAILGCLGGLLGAWLINLLLYGG